MTGSRTATLATLGAILILAPLPFGGVQPAAVLAIEIAVALALGVALWTLRNDPASPFAGAREHRAAVDGHEYHQIGGSLVGQGRARLGKTRQRPIFPIDTRPSPGHG